MEVFWWRSDKEPDMAWAEEEVSYSHEVYLEASPHKELLFREKYSAWALPKLEIPKWITHIPAPSWLPVSLKGQSPHSEYISASNKLLHSDKGIKYPRKCNAPKHICI